MRTGSFESLSGIYSDVPTAMVGIVNDAFQAMLDHLSTSEILSGRIHQDHDPASEPQIPSLSEDNRQFSPTHLTQFPAAILQASRLASLIFLRATRQNIPFEHPMNFDDAKHLGTLLNETPLSTWRGIPYIYLWV